MPVYANSAGCPCSWGIVFGCLDDAFMITCLFDQRGPLVGTVSQCAVAMCLASKAVLAAGSMYGMLQQPVHDPP
jgi:hypothetical protein